MPSTPEKIALRERALDARRALAGEARRAATAALAERAFAQVAGAPGIVGLYCAFRDEFHPGTLMERLAGAGRLLALPATPAFGAPLVFRRWAPGEPLVRGRMNIPEPAPEAPEVLPQVLVVPPVAFDRRGFRIGYGAGFYDRTIPILRAHHPLLVLGVAFACQEVEAVPDEPHDAPLDAIATERETILPEAT